VCVCVRERVCAPEWAKLHFDYSCESWVVRQRFVVCFTHIHTYLQTPTRRLAISIINQSVLLRLSYVMFFPKISLIPNVVYFNVCVCVCVLLCRCDCDTSRHLWCRQRQQRGRVGFHHQRQQQQQNRSSSCLTINHMPQFNSQCRHFQFNLKQFSFR